MARKISLREFQQRVADRLRDLSSRGAFASKLGFRVGSENWLVDLADVSEVTPTPNFVHVPRTRDWFKGVANVRGRLYSVVDFSAFQGFEPISTASERRVVLINERIIEGSGMLVSRMLGLRNPEDFQRTDQTDSARPWLRATLVDAVGTVWNELDLVALARHPRFLEVGTLAEALSTA